MTTRFYSHEPETPFNRGDIVEVSKTIPFARENITFSGRRGVVLGSRTPGSGYTMVRVKVFPEKYQSITMREFGLLLHEMENGGVIFAVKYPEVEFVHFTLERVSALDQLAEL